MKNKILLGLLIVIPALVLVIAACEIPEQPSDPVTTTTIASTTTTTIILDDDPNNERDDSVIIRTCEVDADCVVMNVGNCCGYYPQCLNRDSITDPEYQYNRCMRRGFSPGCAYPPEIDSCGCIEGRCVAAADTDSTTTTILTWQTIDANGRFSFKIPGDMTEEAVRGIDSYVEKYIGHGMEIAFDYGMYGGLQTNRQEQDEYWEIEKTIGGYDAVMYGHRNAYESQFGHYMATVVFLDVSDGDNKLVLTVYYENSENVLLAREILESVKFP